MGGDKLSWRFHPLRARPALSAVALGFILACAYGAVVYVSSLSLSLPLVAIFLFSFHRYFLPSSYSLDRDGVTVETPFGAVRKPWSDFRGFATARNGVLLTRLGRPSTLDRWRGLFLYTPSPERRDLVVNFLKELI